MRETEIQNIAEAETRNVTAIIDRKEVNRKKIRQNNE